MPLRLRPTAPIAADAVLVGDPGRALMLAQELLREPKMSNHARGLWGYSGRTPGGTELTIQATGMGGPSAALVLTDLAGLGVRRAIRVGTCTALDPDLPPGQLLCIAEAHAWGGPRGQAGAAVFPDRDLAARLRRELDQVARQATVASLDTLHVGSAPAPVDVGDATDMQTAALLAAGERLGVAVAAVLIVSETALGEGLDDEATAIAAKTAGNAASAVLSA
jgi:uridine phosphorylase